MEGGENMSKDYDYGNYFYKLRKESGLSQVELAKKLGVTNKAVSKWENGTAKPSLNLIEKLAEIFDVEIHEIVSNLVKKNKKKITKIVITGGPCSGKSTAASWIQHEFTKKGYSVLFVPETATELILGGIAPWTLENNKKFQKSVLKLQIQKEKIFEESAEHVFSSDKILIVCDRGTVDGLAYMENEREYNSILKELGLTHTLLRDNYDAVFHLVTAAKGAREFYSLENNKARTETPEEAIEKDEKIISAWTGHPHLRIIDNSTGFKEKMLRLLNEISAFLGEPDPYEIERKFLIDLPDLKKLEDNPKCHRVEILQTYLKSQENEETRIRQRGMNGEYTYTLTTKKKISDMKRIEKEKRITEAEYLNFLMNADPSRKQIRKVRYCLVAKNRYFEIDVYPDWKDHAILEIELNNENEQIIFPENIKIIKEVTNDPKYSNYNLSKI